MRVGKRALAAARVAFLVGGGWFIWRSLEGRGDDLQGGIAATPWWGLLLSLVLVCVGLLCTGVLWQRILRVFGNEVALRPALAIFFFGQLGKYIPGSVWSFGAQAGGARAHGVPVLKTVNASLVFLGLHVATGAVLGFGGVLLLGDRSPIPPWLAAAGALGGVVALLPPVVNRVARLVGRIDESASLGLDDEGGLLALMAAAWVCYAGSLFALRPSSPATTVLVMAVAYAIGYVAGVVVFVAPAGVGAREAVFVLIAGHTLGVGNAAALALLTRMVMTVADVLLAVTADLADRWAGRSAVRQEPEV